MIKDQLENNENVKPNTKLLNQLKENFPDFFDKDNNFMLDKFKNTLKSDEINITKEGYELNFLGKSYARFQTSTETETIICPLNNHNKKDENKNSENLYIIGDNLDAIKHLLKSYSRKVKCIYIDPPYNTGNDGFVYPDSFKYDSVTLSNKMGIDAEEAERIIDMRGKSTHSAWITFIYPRLVLARELLSDDGVIFISIDDNEQANLKLICDEIFGEENNISTLPTIMNLKGNQDEFAFAGTHEYTLAIAKNINNLTIKQLNLDDEEIISEWEEDNKGYFKKGASLISTGQNAPRELRPNLWYPILYKNGEIFLSDEVINNKLYNDKSKTFNDDLLKEYSLKMTSLGYTVLLPYSNNKEASWRWSYRKLKNQIEDIIITETKNGISLNKKQRPEIIDLPSKKMKSLLYKPEYSSGNGTNELTNLLEQNRLFTNPKPVQLIEDLVYVATNNSSIILDFFSGSATTAHAVMKLNAEDGGNRKYILVQLPEEIEESKPAFKAGYKTIDEIGRERIKRAAQKIKEETNADIDYGFKVVKLENVQENTLERLESFDPNVLVSDDYVNDFSNEDSSGLETILTTWLNQDGYGLHAKWEDFKLVNYIAHRYSNSLYIVNEGIESSDISRLIEMIENNELNISRIVIYTYSLPFTIINELKTNIKNLRNNKTVDIIERY